MTAFPGTPRVLKGAFITLDSQTLAVARIVSFQYNPETLVRTLQPDTMVSAPRQTITFSLALDASDALEASAANSQTVRLGLHPALAALETLMCPPIPLILFAWGKSRIMPVQLTGLQITERLFDPALNPIQVEAALTLTVRRETEFAGFPGGSRYWDQYLANLKQLAQLAPAGTLSNLGLTGI